MDRITFIRTAKGNYRLAKMMHDKGIIALSSSRTTAIRLTRGGREYTVRYLINNDYIFLRKYRNIGEEIRITGETFSASNVYFNLKRKVPKIYHHEQ